MSEKTAKKIRRIKREQELSSHVIGAHNIDDVINKIVKKPVDPLFLVIDLFCGAGGTSTGFEKADGLALVIACVNHDPKAIKSHWRNYPHVAHFEEDIRKLDLHWLIRLKNFYKKLYPNALVVLFGSLECTNFSKAKGGLPRDPNSRTLANHLERYIVALQPDYIQIENVVEFMSWGPLDNNGRPVSKDKGEDWMRWREMVRSYGYTDEWREMNSADFGAYTARNRLFGIFAKGGLPIVWPIPTHAKNPSKFSIHGKLKKWKAVKDVLDLEDEGPSYFKPGRIKSQKTDWRILKGLRKFCKNEMPGQFIYLYYSNGQTGSSLNKPSGSLLTNPKQKLLTAKFINEQFGNSVGHSLDDTAKVIMPNHKQNLVTAFIVNPQFNNCPVSIHEAGPTIIAIQDKKPLSLAHIYFDLNKNNYPDFISVDNEGRIVIEVYESDSEPRRLIKEFMAENGILDIRMRRLKIIELLKIQGFPPNYDLEGTLGDQGRFIGNSVVPIVIKKWVIAMADGLTTMLKFKVA